MKTVKPSVHFFLIFLFFTGFPIAGCHQKEPSVSAKATSSFQLGQYVVYDTFDTGLETYVRSLAVDRPFLWVGSSRGVLKIQRTSGVLLQTFTQKDGLKSPYIFTISPSKNGVIWFGTNAGGLTRLDGEGWTTFLPPELADSWVYQIAYDHNGVMWIGTWNGVSRYDGNTFVNYRVKDGLVNPWVYAIAVDRDQSVWMGTEGGVNRFDGKIWQTWTHRDGLGAPNTFQLPRGPENHSGSERLEDIHLGRHRHNLNTLDENGKETYNENYVFSMFIDAQGVKWFGTWGGGLSRFDGKEWKNYTSGEGLAGNIVYAISPDEAGGLWLGTNHGISHFNGKAFVNFSKKEGLPYEDVYAVVQDSDQMLWAGQKNGVTRLMPKSLVSPQAR
jgi:ligand-binding sensor domain-containing protein